MPLTRSASKIMVTPRGRSSTSSRPTASATGSASDSPEREALMTRYLCTVVVLASVVTLAAAQAPAPPQPTTVDGAVTHVYKSIAGTDLRLHVFSPSTRSAKPEAA